MKRIIEGLDVNRPQFVGQPLGSLRRLLWEVGASVLVVTGLIMKLAGFAWQGWHLEMEQGQTIVQHLSMRLQALANPTPVKIKSSARRADTL